MKITKRELKEMVQQLVEESNTDIIIDDEIGYEDVTVTLHIHKYDLNNLKRLIGVGTNPPKDLAEVIVRELDNDER